MKFDEDSANKAKKELEERMGGLDLFHAVFIRERRSAHESKSGTGHSDRMTDEAGADHTWVMRIRDTTEDEAMRRE
jgi:hypothetical protein